MSKLARILVLIGALALIFGLMAVLGMRPGSRSALRSYLAELKAKGERLSFEELSRDWTTNLMDAHAAITNAVARLTNAPLAPGLLGLQKPRGPGQASVTWRQDHPIGSRAVGFSGSGTWAELDAQIKSAQGPLQEIRLALQVPSLHEGPCTNVWTERRVNFVAIRIAAQWLVAAAEDDLHQGRLEAASQNLEALAGLAYMERDESTLVAQMIRIAVAGMGLSATWEALQAPGWTELQLERLQKAWEPVDLLDAVEKGFVGERAGGYEIFRAGRYSSGTRMRRALMGSTGSAGGRLSLEELLSDYLIMPAYRLTSIDQDELFYLKTMQEGISSLRLLKAHRSWPEAQQKINMMLTNVSRISRPPQRFRYLFSVMIIPSLSKAAERAIEAENTRQLTLAAIALKRYQLCRGRLPPNLEALIPDFLPAVPQDYMRGRPLTYRPTADGTYLLYSVGKDGKDDGGDPSPPPGSPIGLWTGRDAVWLSPSD